ncbi:MAG: UDP-N-acetylglucosamine 4,6-dehydratase (inverting) [Pirellulaceae bacterium]
MKAGRDAMKLFNDQSLSGQSLVGSDILITGGTGSFGKKCAQTLLKHHNPRRLVIFSRDEQKHVDMARTLFPPSEYPQIRYFIGDVRDYDRLRRSLQGIDYVVHAAAMKHVDMAEYNPQECIHTNILGAENMINACLDCGVKKLVGLSTDKAASPINLYGATKLCSDKLFVSSNALSGADGCRFAVVRYGNVFGSNGSVVPFFLRQRHTGTLPITDERMTRFIITLEQGVNFVLQAFDRMVGGEIFVPKIPSIKIMDIANTVAPECKTKIIGIRPGEKLHECMIPVDEARQTLEFDDHFVIEPASASWPRNADWIAQGVPCPDGFCYSSDNNTHWLTKAELQEMIRPFAETAAESSNTPPQQSAA